MRAVKMLKTTNGSNNGYDVKAFLEQETYEVGNPVTGVTESLATAFVDELKVAEYVDAVGGATEEAPAGDAIDPDAVAADADAAAKAQAAKNSKAVAKAATKA